MAGSFRIAEGYVEVTADESAYDRAMDRLKSKRQQVRVGVQLDDRDAIARLDRLARDRIATVKLRVDEAALARLRLRDIDVTVTPQMSDAAYRRVQTQLDRLAADRVVNIRASVDTRVAADEIRNLTARRQVRIGIDVDTRVAADSLANLTRRRQMTVGVRADTADADARIRTLTRDRRVDVRLNVNRSSLAILSSIGGGGGGGLGLLSSSLSRIIALAVAALPTLASLGQSIAAMGPAAAVAAPAILSLGTAFAAIKVGTSGIGVAFKQAFAPATSSANAAESATKRVESAQRSLAKAQQAVKDAEVNAARARVRAAREIEDAQQALKNTVRDVADSNRRAAEQVENAERDLADAQRAARQAQLDLNDARKEAAEDLQDLNNRLADAQLDQRQKVLDLQDAERELAAVKAKGSKATQQELDQAQLNYDRAKQALQEQQIETERLQQETAEATKAGVEGSEKVKDAKDKVRDATQQARDKARELRDAELEAARAQEDGAQRIAKAQRDVADAQAAAAQAAADGARQIADAQEAAREAAQAYADAQTAGATATSKTADALAALSPNARAFVEAVLAQAGAWRALKLDVQDRLFQGLGSKFSELSTAVIPSLREGLVGMAGNLNTTAVNAGNAVIELAKTGQLRQMFDGLNGATGELTRIPGQIITALTQISIAASPAFERLTKAAGAAADDISKRIADAFESGALEESINNGVEIAKQFGDLLGDIFATIGNIMEAAAAGGGDALGSLGSVFAELRRITAMPEVQQALTAIFQAVQSIATLFATTLGAVIEAALPLLAALAPVVTELAEKFGPTLAELAGQLGAALLPIIDSLLPVVSDIGDILVDLVTAVLPLLQPLGSLIGSIIDALAPWLPSIGQSVTILAEALVTGLLPVVGALVPVFDLFGQLVGQLAPLFPPILQALVPLLPPLGELTVALLNLALQVLTPLLPLIVELASLFTTVLAGAITILVPAITTVIEWITTFTTAITDGVKWIVDKFQWLYDVLVGHSIIPDLVNAIIGWFRTLWTKTKELLNTLKKGTVQIWKDLWTDLKGKWDTFWKGLRTAVSSAWTSLKNSVSGLKTSITNTWSSMWNGAKDKMTGTFTTIGKKIGDFKNSMKNAFSTLRDSLGTIWNGVKSKISAPVKWVVQNVYNNGMRKMWNTIAGKISSKLTLPAISLGFNKGGVVPGTGNSDTVPAMLTPGERILSKQQVTRLGGHRAIDAMLGQDKPTRTGGNPSQQEEKRRYQGPVQHFDTGGIVGKVTSGAKGLFGGALDWAKDLVIGGLKKAAQKAISSLVRPLVNMIPGGGFGGLLKGLTNKTLDSMLSFLGNEDKKAVGGPAVQRALAWAKTQNGLPYQWAGNGNPSWDCSGFMSAIESVIRGEKPHRRWATGAFAGNNGPSGWVRNLNSPFMIGITNAGVGHTAGTIAGVNVESRGGDGVVVGKRARSYRDGLFTSRWGFAPATKYDSGGLLQPGATMAVNATRRPERILDAQQTQMFEQLVSGSRGGGSVTIENITISGTFDFASPAARRAAANALVKDMKEALRRFDRERA